MAKNYYEILGVDKSATKDELKAAYKKLAKKHHPDLNKGNKNAEEKFKEVNEAYSVLGDDNARRNYDQYGTADSSAGFQGDGFGFNADVNINDIFESVFGEEFSFGGFGRRRKKSGSDLRYDLEITLEEAAFGVEKNIEIRKLESCDECNGTGAKKKSDIISCSQCDGSGYIKRQARTPFGYFTTTTTCGKCSGTGKQIKNLCPECNGAGRINKKRKIEISIPEGIDNNQSLRISGEGEALAGHHSGDLYVVIHVKPHDIFERRGNDIYCEIPVSFVVAAMGGEIEVPILNGKAKLKVPAGTQSNTIFRMHGKGVHYLNRLGAGDQNVKVFVQVPEKLTKRQEELLHEFASEGGDEVKPVKKGFFERIREGF